MRYVDVAVFGTNGQVFTYAVENSDAEKFVSTEKTTLTEKTSFTEETSLRGAYVEVPLRNRKCLGVVVSVKPSGYTPTFTTRKAKPLGDGRHMDALHFVLAKEIARHAFCTEAEALELFAYELPKSERKLKERQEVPALGRSALSAQQSAVVDEILRDTEAKGKAASATATAEPGTDPLHAEPFRTERPLREVLLHGVTGSGKTEVYFELMQRALDAGRTALFLVPEITLTPQMRRRIKSAFGEKRVAVVHSKVTKAQRARYMRSIASGEIDIVIGARSAVLSPLRNIGVIIFDECHETSYVQNKRPRYDTLKLVRTLAREQGSLLVLGSATPNVDMYYEFQKKQALYTLSSRYNDYALPSPKIVDMRKEADKLISADLDRAIRDRLETGEQVILFLNRKGFSSMVMCSLCGEVLKCPNCEISLTYYKDRERLACNYCGHEQKAEKHCPTCGSDGLMYAGTGTERLETEVRKRYPSARVARLDRSVLTSDTRMEELLRQFGAGEIDILIGTQMVAKGLDFPKVTLVGIVSADLQFNIPSYLAAERAFQIFTQVAGRSGRGGLRSEVILQTFKPDHKSIVSTTFEEFYHAELEFRRRMNYPPFTSLALLTLSDKEEAMAWESAMRTKQYLRKRLAVESLQNTVKILEERPAMLKRLDNMYRYQVMVLSENESFPRVVDIMGELESRLAQTTGSLLVVDIGARE